MKTIYTLVLLLTSLLAFAQKCELCQASLNDGVFDEYKRKTNLNYDYSLKILFTRDYTFWSNYENYSHKTAELDAGFSLFEILDANTNYETQNTNITKKQKFEELRLKYRQNQRITLNLKEEVNKRIASKDVLDAWLTCMKGCDGSNKFSLRATPISNEEFIITLNWFASDGLNEASTIVENVIFTNSNYIGGDLKKGRGISKGGTLAGTFTRRNKYEDVAVVVVIQKAGAKEIIINKHIDIPVVTLCEEKPDSHKPNARFFMPPRTRGDAEYDGSGPMVTCTGNLIVSPDKKTITVRITFEAKETESDWTTASGSFEEQIYAAPAGYNIISITSPTTYNFGYTDDDHADDPFPGNGFIESATYRGDRKGNDAGMHTSVNLVYNTISVALQQCCNCTPK